MQQVETITICSRAELDIPMKPKKHFPGSNMGSVFSGVALPALQDLWTLSFGQKKDIYGPFKRVRPGGRGEIEGLALSLVIAIMMLRLRVLFLWWKHAETRPHTFVPTPWWKHVGNRPHPILNQHLGGNMLDRANSFLPTVVIVR